MWIEWVEKIRNWLEANPSVLWWGAGLSLVMFFGMLAAAPWLAIRLPRSYLQSSSTSVRSSKVSPPVIVLRNAAGITLILAGLAMLVLPGQGLLTLFIGLMLTDLPGKRRLMRFLLRQPRVFETINRLREKAGKPPLDAPEAFEKKQP